MTRLSRNERLGGAECRKITNRQVYGEILPTVDEILSRNLTAPAVPPSRCPACTHEICGVESWLEALETQGIAGDRGGASEEDEAPDEGHCRDVMGEWTTSALRLNLEPLRAAHLMQPQPEMESCASWNQA